MAAGYAIPPNLVEAFRNDIQLLDEWKWGGQDPKVLLEGREYTIGYIADFASIFNDPMPEDICARLFEVAGFGTILKDRTFAAGGELLGILYTEIASRHTIPRQ